MLLTAAAQLGLDLGKSWMVGDRWSDIEAGRAAGCRTVFIDYGYIESQPNVNPGYKVTSFTAAVDLILRNNTSKLFI
jgi:D-glycero-D-manno-heptose 1,7-bisphosphate phosphatase